MNGRCVVAADLADVLGERDVLDPADLVFDDPVSPAPGGQLGRDASWDSKSVTAWTVSVLRRCAPLPERAPFVAFLTRGARAGLNLVCPCLRLVVSGTRTIEMRVRYPHLAGPGCP